MIANSFLIIFPSKRQLDFLSLNKAKDAIAYVVLQNNSHELNNKKNIHFYTKDDAESIVFLKEQNLNILCCHEESLFWVRLHRSDKWVFPFNTSYLSLLEKDSFKNHMNQYGVLVSNYTLNSEDVVTFPIVAKPSIGFGSIGVKFINDKNMLNDYIRNFAEFLSLSAIWKYQSIYFMDKTNKILFEAQINGDFYRTPFIVHSGICADIFPIKGKTKLNSTNTDYKWMEFEFLPNTICSLGNEIADMHNQIVEIFNLSDGVYISEFIISENNKPVLLEFSPRQPSDRICKTVFLATGIDLETEVLNSVFKNIFIGDRGLRHQIRLRIQSNQNQFDPLDDYVLIEEDIETSVHGEKIKCMFLQKI